MRFILFVVLCGILVFVQVRYDVLDHIALSVSRIDGEKSLATSTLEVVHTQEAVAEIKESARSAGKVIGQVTTSGPLKVLSPMYGSNLTVSGTILETNIARALEGKLPLKENHLLNEAALKKAQDMLDGQYFEHESPQGEGPADIIGAVGYTYITVGENLALGHFKDDKALVTAWMNSPGHRENILHPRFTEIGVGIVRGKFEGQEVWIAVQEFGKPASSCPSVDKVLGQGIEENKALIEQRSQQLEELRQEIEDSTQYSGTYRSRVSQYNDLVEVYNTLVKETKIMVDEYNMQVKTFNACIQS